MKKLFVCSCIFVFATCLFTACSNDDDTENFNNVVEIDENGSTSNGSRYTPIDDKNFYLDYIKYSIENKHIVVTGYDKAGIYGVARIVSSIKYKGEQYDVLRIAEYAFENCNSLTSIRIPNSVTSIEKDAFRGCSGLTSITIPNSVTSIGSGAFSGCSGLKKVIVSDIAAWCGIKFVDNPLYYAKHLYSDENTEIKNLVIPNNVTSISNRAFYGCSGLIYVTIGNGVTSIGSGAFYGADIAAVISLIENPFKIDGKSPESDNGTFSLYTFNNATLYVPNGTIDKYKTTNGWKDFRFIKEGSPF